MRCPHCNTDVRFGRELCPNCGQKLNFDYATAAHSANYEAAELRTKRLEGNMRLLLVLMTLAGAVIYSLNDLWDTKLTYSGAQLPMIEVPPAKGTDPGSTMPSYRELVSLPGASTNPPRSFGYRFSPFREQLREANGGDDQIVLAIQSGLNFLSGEQDKRDGSWPVDLKKLRGDPSRDETGVFQWARTGITALALLPFLAEGEYWFPNKEGQRSLHTRTITMGLQYLMRNQDERTGRFGPAEGNFMYNHGLATLAVTEAAAMSGDSFLYAAAQRGLDLIQRTQGEQGGWGYQDKIMARQDTSVTAWQVQALLAGKEAGMQIDDRVLERALDYYRKATDPVSGRVAYDFGDNMVRPNLYGVALACRVRLGENSSIPVIRLLAGRVMEHAPTVKDDWGRFWRYRKEVEADALERARVFDPYRWYFATYGMFMSRSEQWPEWNENMKKTLLKMQDADHAWRGNDIWTIKIGASYSTALSLLTLQVYYRNH